MTFPSLDEIEKSIIEFSQLGVKVMFTELDISVLPSPWSMPSADINVRFKNNETMNPYSDGIPDSVNEALAKRYGDIFALFNVYKAKISRVTFWGLHDGISWKNGFPIRGRTDYPLIFDREMKPKKAYWKLIELMEKKIHNTLSYNIIYEGRSGTPSFPRLNVLMNSCVDGGKL